MNLLPDENHLLMPDEWRAELLPRRGVRPGEVFEPDPDAPALWRELVGSHEAALRSALTASGDPDGVEYLDGRPNPRGAGIVAAMAAPAGSPYSVPMVRPALDAWIEEHGLPFAVGASLSFLSIEDNSTGSSIPLSEAIVEYDTRRFRDRPLSMLSSVLYLSRDFHTLRGLLADVSDEVYAEAEAVVDRLRDNETRRYLAAFLMPRADWVEETVREVAALGAYKGHLVTKLAHSVTSRAQFTAMGMRVIEPYDYRVGFIAPLLDGLGAEALPLLTAPPRHPLDADQRRNRLQAIAILPHDETAAHLVEHLAEQFAFEAAAAAAERYPARMLRAVAAHAPDAPPERRPLLAGLAARADPRAHDTLTEAERAALDELRTQVRPVPEAAEADLPELLVRPPWTVKRPKRKPVVVKGLEADPEVRAVWTPGERERYLADAAEHAPEIGDWDEYAEHLNRYDRNRRIGMIVAYGPERLADAFVGGWNGDLSDHDEERSAARVQAVLARYGGAVGDRVVAHLVRNVKLGALMGPVLSPEAARIAAHWFANVKSAQGHAAAWLDRHGAAAATLLVPGALDRSKTRRAPAEAALLRIAETHGAEAVLDAAAAYGEPARAGIAALLEAGPADLLPDRVPDPGKWFDPTMLPQVLLRGGEAALPESSLRHVAVVLGMGVGMPDDPRLAVVAETCDRDSLRGFSWTVFEQWIAGGAPAADRWALGALRHFGDDGTVARLTPLVKEWPGQSQHHRAVAGLQVLGGIGSEAALRAMQHISQRAKFKAIKAEAAHQMKIIAAGLGLTREQLADRLLPDFGLGGDGALVLDYGPRRFRVIFDEQLKPHVADESGKPRKTLPKPGAKDDPELAGAAYKRFGELKKELRTVSVDQVRRLEAAMINARTWSREEFEQYLQGHPLMRHLVRRMVWLAETGEGRFGFRVAEDGSLSDAADEAVALPEGAVVRLAHPIDLAPEECAAWGQVLADYEILQPFEQLGRPVMAFTEEELATGRLERFEGAVVPPGSILGLTKHGWVRGRPQDNGTEYGFHFPLPAGGYVAVALSPGLQIGAGADVEDQRFEAVYLTDRLDSYYHKRDGERPAGVDPVIASEVLAALDRVTVKQ